MSYKDLLKARPADIIPPKPIPPGPFKVRIASHEFSTAGKKNTECVNFSLRLLEPGDEVDPDLLEAAKDDLAKAKPVYTTLPGLVEPVTGARRISDLPANARQYLDTIERTVGVPLAFVSVGPDREQTIVAG